jgi:hypothetical protein
MPATNIVEQKEVHWNYCNYAARSLFTDWMPRVKAETIGETDSDLPRR